MKLSIAGFALLAGITPIVPAHALPGTGAPCDIANATLSIGVGQTASGRLDSSDCTQPDGSYADFHRIVVRTAGRLAITMRSGDFDAYLVLLDDAGESIDTDDDGAGGTDSAIEANLEPGTYYLVANTLSEGETGAYTLAVASSPAGTVATAGRDCVRSAAGVIEAGRVVSGTLGASDCVREDGSYAEYFRFVLTSRQTVRIAMESEDFDTFLVLYGTSEESIDSNDDGDDGTNSVVETTLDAGTYYILVNSLAGGSTGDFTLSMRQSVPSGSVTLASRCSAALAQRSIAPGGHASGSLDTSDCRREDGTYGEYFKLVLPARQRVTITLTSDDFDAYLVLLSAADEALGSDDDGAGDTDARIVETLEAGTYYVIANALAEDETGEFMLSVAVADPAASEAACAAIASIRVGQSIRAELSDTDCQQRDDSFADMYRLIVASPADVTITLESAVFDTFLVLRDANGVDVASNDDGEDADGTNSRLARHLAAGTYYILANSLASDERGAYLLTVKQSP